jgi:hypothetical protein
MFLQTFGRLALLAVGILSLLVIVHAQEIKPVDPTIRKPLEEAESTYDREEDARRAKPALVDPKAAVEVASSDALHDALGGSLPLNDLSLSLEAASFKVNDDSASVALAIEIDGRNLPLAPGGKDALGKLELSFFSIDQNGNAGTGTKTEIDLTRLQPETYERIRAHGLRFNPRITLAPGRYQLRVGARESRGGAIGSVFRELVVPDLRNEPLVLSGMLLTSASAQRTPTAEPDALVRTLLPGAATSRRTFPAGDTLTLYVELYANDSLAKSDDIDVTVRLISESGKDIFVRNDSIPQLRSTRQHVARSIPLRDVPPGPYTLQVEARLSARNPALVARETSITVTPRATVASVPKEDPAFIVDRAARYVKAFVSGFSNVVAEEVYLQQRIGPRIERDRRREMTSDFLFVRATASEDWLVFRDVRLVDGREVRKEKNGLLNALTSPVTDAHRLESALAAENVRHSLPRWPIFNNPLIAIGILQDQYRDRFDFSWDRSSAAEGTVVLRFRERAAPTILRVGGTNMFSTGRLWIDPGTGSISQTELEVGRNATVTTFYAYDEQLKMSVPVEMRERYDLDAYAYATGLAKYSNFRTFQVQTDEALTEKDIP